MKRNLLRAILMIVILCFLSASSAQAATQEQIDNAIDKGLVWLVNQQQSDGRWSYSGWDVGDVSTTGLALTKLVDRAKELKLDPFDNNPGSPTYYPYANNVIAGFNYLFSNASTDAAGVNFLGWVYSTGNAMMAVASTNAPGRIITTGPLAGDLPAGIAEHDELDGRCSE